MAHAPMVTSRRELCRICWMRSASSAVVIEPSTSDRSYGPVDDRPVASGK